LPVLTFHRVAPEEHGVVGLKPVSPEQFRRYLRWISGAGFTPITPAEWLSHVRSGTPDLRRPVLITFDDAYAELEAHALPALEEARFASVVFVPTDFIGATNRWDQKHGFTDIPLMDERSIAAWSGRGVIFGSHGASHADLAELEQDARCAELDRSMRRLREITGAGPDAIAYPYGAVNADAATDVARRFSLGFTTQPGLNAVSTNPVELRRAAVPPSASWLRFRLLLALGFDPIYRLAEIIRPRRWLRGLLARIGRPQLR